MEERLAGRLVAYLDVDGTSQHGPQNGRAVIRRGTQRPHIVRSQRHLLCQTTTIRDRIVSFSDNVRALQAAG